MIFFIQGKNFSYVEIKQLSQSNDQIFLEKKGKKIFIRHVL